MIKIIMGCIAALAMDMAAIPSAFAQDKLVLVTASEAALPSVPVGELSRRGVTRGPKITLVSPAKPEGNKSPLHFELKFETFGGAKIDPAALKVSYLKKPSVDLTDRMKPFLQGTALNIKEAEMPPGDHVIRVDVKDTDGRLATALFTLNVVP
jgi:hypothetical protein